MKWKITDIATWNPGRCITETQCREMFGNDVASMNGPHRRYFYNGEDLMELNKSVFSGWMERHAINRNSVKHIVTGYSYLPAELMNLRPGIEVHIANALDLANSIPVMIPNRYCSTIPSVIGYLENERIAGRLNAGDYAMVSVMDFPSIDLEKDISHHPVSRAIFGDGAFFMLMEITDSDSDFSAGYVIENVLNCFVHSTADKAYSDSTGALHLSRYMTDEVPELIYNMAIEPSLKQNGITAADVRRWILHPGGIPIIAGVEKRLGLEKNSLDYVYDTFYDGGNRFAVSAGYVLDRVDKNYPKNDGDIFVMGTAALGIHLGAVVMRYRTG